ncbi:hypothetical protein [Gimesia sp.]|uniref:hypothetical protein n=1 Tax=Gimesia sp. TaxID=2024833 RepID=UPI003A8EF872
MSFDVFFQTAHISDKTEEAVNPFTGETVQKPVGERINAEERSRLQELFAQQGAAEPDDFGCYLIEFEDGTGIELFFSGLADNPDFNGGMAALRSLTTNIVSFLFAVADQGNLVILPAMDEMRPLVTSAENAERVLSRWSDTVVVSSPAELLQILSGGFGDWSDYRDRVVNDE